jgi:3-oxoacyl-[acyl-carrier protein] reductase
VALVTGGGTGLGAAVCRCLARARASVAVNYATSAAAATALVEELRAGGANAVAIQADLGNPGESERLVAQAVSTLGPVDLLVNNAATTKVGPWGDLDAVAIEDWDRLLRVNLLAAWECTRAAVRSMRRTGGGAIVNVASDSVFNHDSGSLPYVVTKTALVGLTRALAVALAPEITVNAVAPGWMDTPWFDRHLTPEARAQLVPDPGGMVVVDDVAAEIVRLLASGETGRVMLMLPGAVPRHVPMVPAG